MRRGPADDLGAVDHKDDKPITLVVRRGALRRYDKLKRETADLPVVVTWDRRRDDRDAGGASVPPAVERRRQLSFTWEMADFVVVPGNEAAADQEISTAESASATPSEAPAAEPELPARKSS